MSINIIKEEIEILIETIKEQYDIIKVYKGKIPHIEIDIIMSNVRDLYEYLNELNKINTLRRTQQTVEISTEIIEKISKNKAAETVVHESIIVENMPTADEVEQQKTTSTIIIESNETPVVSEEIIISETSDIKAEIQEPELSEIYTEEKQPSEIKKEVKEPKKSSKREKTSLIDLFAETDKVSVSDKFKDEKKSINEKLGEERKDKSFVDKIQKKPIKDLKTAIGINDKFIFISELFKGSLEEYNKSIEKINSFNTVNEAFSYLEELKETFNWSEKQDIFARLEDFVLRKFL